MQPSRLARRPAVTRWEWIHAVQASDAPPTTKHVCIAIATTMNQSGDPVSVSLPTLADLTGLSRRSIQRAIKGAMESGLLRQGISGRTRKYSIGDTVSPVRRVHRGHSDTLPDEKQVTECHPSRPLESDQAGSLIAPSVRGSSSPRRSGTTYPHSSETSPPSLQSDGQKSQALELLRRLARSSKTGAYFAAKLAGGEPFDPDGHPTGGELLAWIIDLTVGQEGLEWTPRERAKFGACCKRIAEERTRKELLNALLGMECTFPYSEGQGWDPMVFERNLPKAIQNSRNHPALKAVRAKADFRSRFRGGR